MTPLDLLEMLIAANLCSTSRLALPCPRGSSGRWRSTRRTPTAPSYGYSGNLNISYKRLNTLAQAYSQPGTGLTGDSGLRDDILTGLDHPFRL
jgi:hypothetical protein